MDCTVELGLRGTELQRVNRVRKAQDTGAGGHVSLSDVARENGRYLEVEDYLLVGHWKDSSDSEGRLGNHRSTLNFGIEYPTQRRLTGNCGSNL